MIDMNIKRYKAQFAMERDIKLTFKKKNIANCVNGEGKKKTIAAGIWNIVGFGAQNAARLFANLILTRLLLPEMFGTMAIVQVIVSGLALFSDIGIGPSLIQNDKRDNPKFYNSAWTIQVIRGSLLWLGSLIVAYPVSRFYDNQHLLIIIPIVGSTAFIAGFRSTSLYILNQKLELKKIIILELKSQVAGIMTMIVWAMINRSIWSLVAGSIIASSVRTLLSHSLMAEHKNYLIWEKSEIIEIISFGKWIFVSTATMFLASQADRIILGKLISLSTLGVYTIALALAEIPKQIISQISMRVIFPVATHFSNLTREKFNEKIVSKRWTLINLCGVGIAIGSCFGDYAIYFLYDERYYEAAKMLPFLSLGIWPMVLSSTTEACLLAIGKSKYKAFGSTAQFICMLFILPLSYELGGVIGLILSLSLKEMPNYIFINIGGKNEGLACIKQDILSSMITFILILLLTYLRYLIGIETSFIYLKLLLQQ